MYKQDLPLLALYSIHCPLRHGDHTQKRSRLEANEGVRGDAEISCAILLRYRQAAQCVRDILQPCECAHGAGDEGERVLQRSAAPEARSGGCRSDKPLQPRLGRDA